MMSDKNPNWSWFWVPLVWSIAIAGLIFLLSWGISGLCYSINFDLYSEMAQYSELTMPVGLETKYMLLGIQLSAILASYISIPIFIILFIIGVLICWNTDYYF